MSMSIFFRERKTKMIEQAVVCPSWMWNAIVTESAKQRVSANVLIRRALSEYLAKYRPMESIADSAESKVIRGE